MNNCIIRCCVSVIIFNYVIQCTFMIKETTETWQLIIKLFYMIIYHMLVVVCCWHLCVSGEQNTEIVSSLTQGILFIRCLMTQLVSTACVCWITEQGWAPENSTTGPYIDCPSSTGHPQGKGSDFDFEWNNDSNLELSYVHVHVTIFSDV